MKLSYCVGCDDDDGDDDNDDDDDEENCNDDDGFHKQYTHTLSPENVPSSGETRVYLELKSFDHVTM